MVRRANPAASGVAGVATLQQTLSSAGSDAMLPSSVSRETFERLETYCALVQKWNRSINLISQGDREVVWTRHVLDSLRLLPLIPNDITHGVDLGSGAGFPGLVLALASGIPFDLVESDRRKAAFLVEAHRVTGAPVRIHCARIEDLHLPPAPLVTARALAPLTMLLGYAHRLLCPDGVALFLKGARAAQEITVAERHWCMQIVCFDDVQHPESTVLAVSRLKPRLII